MKFEIVTKISRIKKSLKTRTLKTPLQPISSLWAHNAPRLALRARRRKYGRTWQKTADRFYPGLNPNTLKRFATEHGHYIPKDLDILKALGFDILPPLLSDVLGILHGPAKLDRAQKRVFRKDPNKARGKQ